MLVINNCLNNSNANIKYLLSSKRINGVLDYKYLLQYNQGC